jgi:pimeloyl-ACP methyl ester carboxylesterase
MPAPPNSLRTLVERYDPEVLDAPAAGARIRLEVSDGGTWDALVDDREARLVDSDGQPDALLEADEATWRAVADDLRGGMDAFRARRLTVRRNLHLGVGLLAATSGMTEPGRLEFESIRTRAGTLSTLQAGTGDPIVALHGLGGTKVSFLPTVAALADGFRVIAVDLPGFGDSDKPIAAPYDARFFGRAVVALLDALDLDRVHLVGNSMGGRVALEVGLRHPDRVRRMVLLSSSLAWRRERPWATLLRFVRPELGLLQVAPRGVVEGIVRRLIPGAQSGWAAAGVDEFLRAYLTPRGRAAFYAAARNIYLEEGEGEDGFWQRLQTLQPPALFVWGRHDKLVPVAFARHVTDALPHAEHVELDCGHVPQLERPRETHDAMARFLRAGERGGADRNVGKQQRRGRPQVGRT